MRCVEMPLRLQKHRGDLHREPLAAWGRAGKLIATLLTEWDDWPWGIALNGRLDRVGQPPLSERFRRFSLDGRSRFSAAKLTPSGCLSVSSNCATITCV
jgi:hypothetical protein